MTLIWFLAGMITGIVTCLAISHYCVNTGLVEAPSTPSPHVGSDRELWQSTIRPIDQPD